MAKNDQDEALEKLLTALLARILDSQKFAETKNAGLIALNSAWLVAGANIISSGRPLPVGMGTAMSIALPLILVSMLGAIWSLLPRLNLSQLLRAKGERHPCLIYFGDIAMIDAPDYAQLVRARYLPEPKQSATAAYLDDLAGQVTANSRITARKFKLFTISAWISAVACLALSGPGVVWLYSQATSQEAAAQGRNVQAVEERAHKADAQSAQTAVVDARRATERPQGPAPAAGVLPQTDRAATKVD